MGELAIEEAVESDRDDIVSLYRRVYPGAGFDEALFSWRYREVPGGPARIFVVREEGRVGAMLVLMPRDLTIGGRRRPGWLIVDVMTAPELRGRGVLRALSTRALEESRLFGRVGCGYPNERSVRGFRSTGWAEQCRVPAWAGPVDADDADPGVWEELEASVGDWVEPLWLALERNGVHRDAELLSWRLSRPDATYHTFATPARDALVVLKLFEGGGRPIVNVVELLAHPGGGGSVARALALAKRFGRRHGATRITTWMVPDHPYRPELLRAGFAEEPTDRILIVDAPEPLRPHVVDARGWHMTQLDSDVY